MSGNSWQQPKSGEPSMGTFHYLFSTLESNYNPGSTPTRRNVDVSTVVPVGTTAVIVTGYAQSTSVGHWFQFRETGGGNSIAGQDTQVANQNIWMATGIVRLDSSYTFDIVFSNSAFSGCYIYMHGYWL